MRRLFLLLLLFVFSTPIMAADVTFTWSPPTEKIDGTPLDDLAGYFIYEVSCAEAFTTSPITCPSGESRTLVADVLDETVSSYTSSSLVIVPGDYYFAMTSYNTSSNESPTSSNIAMVTLLPPTFADPNPPSNLNVNFQ